MVKVISDWERSSAGAGMVNNIVDDSDAKLTEYEFLDGDDCKSFLRERPPHILYLWHLSHKYGILKTVRQQLDGHAVVDGTSAPNVDVATKKRKHSRNSIDPSYSESRKFKENMEHLADSISGLVSVA